MHSTVRAVYFFLYNPRVFGARARLSLSQQLSGDPRPSLTLGGARARGRADTPTRGLFERPAPACTQRRREQLSSPFNMVFMYLGVETSASAFLLPTRYQRTGNHHAPPTLMHASLLWLSRVKYRWQSHVASLYILSRRLRRPIPSCPYRLRDAPAPRKTSPTHPLPRYTPLPSAPNTTFFMLVLGATPVERV